jgi:hypothetical protein
VRDPRADITVTLQLSCGTGGPHALRVLQLQAFAAIAEQIRSDMYLHPHFRYYLREVRVVAYSQVRELTACAA